MLTRIDHVMICVPDLGRGMDAYTRLGFNVHPGGVHTGRGTHNAIAFFEDDYLELLSIRDKDEYLSHSAFGGLVECIEQGGGLRFIILQSDDLAADVAAMRARGAHRPGWNFAGGPRCWASAIRSPSSSSST